MSTGPWGPGAQPPGQQPPPPVSYPRPGPWAPPPQQRNSALKWMLGGVAILLIIAITVGVTVVVMLHQTRGDGPTPTAEPTAQPIASSDDDGPIEIITQEPTCQAWMPAGAAMVKVLEQGWNDRDIDVPSTQWTSRQRSEYDSAAASLRDTARMAVAFARQTPHRVIRAVYEQFIYFARRYAGRVPDYIASDNTLAQGFLAAFNGMNAICNSITYGAAAARGISVEAIASGGKPAPADDPDDPSPAATARDDACEPLAKLHQILGDSTAAWTKSDPDIPAAQWPPEQRALAATTSAALIDFADKLEEVGHDGSTSTFDDLASLSAVYLRGYADALPTYVPADNYLWIAGTRANNLLNAACEAAHK